MRSLICLAIVKKACSTFEAFFADVSRNGIPKLSANSWNEKGKSHQQRYFHDWVLMGKQWKIYLRHGIFDNFLVFHITLVTDEKLINTLSRVTINFLEPLLDVVEGIHVGHIIDDAYAMCTTVVGWCDGSEAFLTSSIPLEDELALSGSFDIFTFWAYNLKLHGLAIQFNSPNFLKWKWLAFKGPHFHVSWAWCETWNTYEVYTDSGNVALRVGVIGKPKQQARLPDTGVSNEEEFEEIVVSNLTVRAKEISLPFAEFDGEEHGVGKICKSTLLIANKSATKEKRIQNKTGQERPPLTKESTNHQQYVECWRWRGLTTQDSWWMDGG